MHLPKVIAHRGASQVALENTLPAFRKAHELGATWVEFDVMLTEDSVAIIHHDDTFLRILGVDKNVHQTSFARKISNHLSLKIHTRATVFHFH